MYEPHHTRNNHSGHSLHSHNPRVQAYKTNKVMEETTAFSKLAKQIGENINGWNWYCCVKLPKKPSKFFQEWFKPTPIELDRYNHLPNLWMSEYSSFNSEDNNLLILALLFAEQLWLDNQQLTPCS